MKSKLIAGIGLFQDLSVAEDGIIEIILFICLTVGNSGNKLGPLTAVGCVNSQEDSRLTIGSLNDIFLGNKEEVSVGDGRNRDLEPLFFVGQDNDIDEAVHAEGFHGIGQGEVDKPVSLLIAP